MFSIVLAHFGNPLFAQLGALQVEAWSSDEDSADESGDEGVDLPPMLATRSCPVMEGVDDGENTAASSPRESDLDSATAEKALCEGHRQRMRRPPTLRIPAWGHMLTEVPALGRRVRVCFWGHEGETWGPKRSEEGAAKDVFGSGPKVLRGQGQALTVAPALQSSDSDRSRGLRRHHTRRSRLTRSARPG